MPFGSLYILTNWICTGFAQVDMGTEFFWLLRPTNYPWLIWIEIFSLDQILSGASCLVSVVLALLARPAAALVTAITELHQDLLSWIHFQRDLRAAGLTDHSHLSFSPNCDGSSPKCSCHCCSCWAQGSWNQQFCCPHSSSVLEKKYCAHKIVLSRPRNTTG